MEAAREAQFDEYKEPCPAYSISINSNLYITPADLPPEWLAKPHANGITLEHTICVDDRDFAAAATLKDALYIIGKREDDLAVLRKNLDEHLASNPPHNDESVCIAGAIANHEQEIQRMRLKNYTYIQTGMRKTYHIEFNRVHQFDDGTIIFAFVPVSPQSVQISAVHETIHASLHVNEPLWDDDSVIVCKGHDLETWNMNGQLPSHTFSFKGEFIISDAVRIGCCVYAKAFYSEAREYSLNCIRSGACVKITKLEENDVLYTNGQRLLVQRDNTLLMLNTISAHTRVLTAIRNDLPQHDHAAIVNDHLYCARDRCTYSINLGDPVAQWNKLQWPHVVTHVINMDGDTWIMMVPDSLNGIEIHNLEQTSHRCIGGYGAIARVFTIAGKAYMQRSVYANTAWDIAGAKYVKCTIPAGDIVREN